MITSFPVKTVTFAFPDIPVDDLEMSQGANIFHIHDITSNIWQNHSIQSNELKNRKKKKKGHHEIVCLPSSIKPKGSFVANVIMASKINEVR